MNIIALNRIDTLCEGGWHQSLGTLRKAHKCLDCAAKIPAGSRDAWTRPLRMPGKRFTVYEFLCATCCFRVQG